jgi:hypothetical protein
VSSNSTGSDCNWYKWYALISNAGSNLLTELYDI